MRKPPSRALRFGLFVVVVGTGFALLRWGPLAPYLEEGRLIERLLELRSRPGAPLIYLAATAVATAFGLPGSIPVLAGGAVFGIALGGPLALIGLVCGAALSYALARWLAHDFVAHLLGRRAETVERLLDNHGFWSLARLRLAPVPFPLLNYALALSGIRFGIFLLSAAVGMIPSVGLMAYFSATIVTAAEAERGGALLSLTLALLALFILSFLPNLLKLWQSRRGRPRPPVDRS